MQGRRHGQLRGAHLPPDGFEAGENQVCTLNDVQRSECFVDIHEPQTAVMARRVQFVEVFDTSTSTMLMTSATDASVVVPSGDHTVARVVEPTPSVPPEANMITFNPGQPNVMSLEVVRQTAWLQPGETWDQLDPATRAFSTDLEAFERMKIEMLYRANSLTEYNFEIEYQLDPGLTPPLDGGIVTRVSDGTEIAGFQLFFTPTGNVYLEFTCKDGSAPPNGDLTQCA